MKDRIPKYAGRIKLVPVPNQPNIYDMERADEPLQEGTPLNRATLLSDETVQEFGLTEDATPDEAMRFLNARRKEFEEEMQDQYNDFLKSAGDVVRGSYIGTGAHGSDNPCVLTFDRPVKMLIILPKRYITADYAYYGIKYGGYDEEYTWIYDYHDTFYDEGVPLTLYGVNYAPQVDLPPEGYIYVTQFDTTVSWYCAAFEDFDAYQQRNASGYTYEYIAFM